MSRCPHASHTAAALAGVGLLAGCAPAIFVPCNSDDDCTRRELCLDGHCAAVSESSAPIAPLERRPAARGDLTVHVVDPRGDGEPLPEPPPPPEPEPDPTDDWVDPGLLRRAVVTIQGLAGLQHQTVADVPVLVALDAADVGEDFLTAARERVLFTTLDGTPLAAELDSDRGVQQFYWVKHTFDPRAEVPTPERFYVYAGGETALVPPEPSEVWSRYFGVYHMGAPRNLPQPDSAGSRTGDNEGAEAETVPCGVGACLFFDGVDDRMVVPSAFPELAGATEATISATVRVTELADSFIAVWSTPDRNRSRFFLGTDGDGVPQAAVRTNDLSPSLHLASGGPAFGVGEEHRLDAVLDMVAGTVALFVDGALRATDTFATNGALPDTASAAAAVGAAAGLAAVNEFDGRVDEVRISAEARGAGFLKVDAASRAGLLTVVTLDR